MSAVAGIGTAQPSQWLQQIARPDRSGASGRIPNDIQTRVRSAAENAGIDTSKLESVRSDMRAAFEKAGPGANPRDVFSGVLEKNGISPGDFKAQLTGVLESAGFSPGAGLGIGSGFGTGAAGFNATSATNGALGDLISALDGDESAGDSSSALLDQLRAPPGSLFDARA
ncbi:MAG: hypothetical protein AAFR38_01070 [Planctomycetota bacterium]